jgi:hypothetical protein
MPIMAVTIEANELRLNILNEKLIKAKVKYAAAEEYLEVAQSDFDEAEEEMMNLEELISGIKKENEFLKLNERYLSVPDSDGSFEWCFYYASLFCNHFNEDRPMLMHVNVLDDKLQGCDGYTAIDIKCNCIPENLKHKLIPWDTMDFLKIVPNEYKYLNVDEVISEAIQNSSKNQTLSKEQIERIMLGDGVLSSEENDIGLTKNVFLLGTIKMAANKDYLERALKCFKSGEQIKLMWDSPISPVIFVNDRINAIVLPIRLG